MNTALNLSSGPHVRDRWTTAFVMHVVLLSLLPATVVGVIVNGVHALLVVLLAMASAFLTEFCFDKLTHRPNTYTDCSALVTGLLLALSLSPNVPLYTPVLGSIFAILVVKCCFGGLGKNFINPALAGRCFLLISFGRSMTIYTIDGVSSATPIAELMAGKAVDITRMFLGTGGGVIGSSILALLVGGLILWGLDIIHGEICFSVLGGFTLFLAIFGGQGFDPKFLAAHLCGGGVVMGAFFMATDYVTSPVSKLGQLTYGLLIGVLGAMFRLYGSAADSFSYSVIIGNLFTPLIDYFVVPKPYAYRKASLRYQRGETGKVLNGKLVKPVVVLSIIALLAGLALSGVFSMTKDTIDAQKLAAKAESYRAVCPDADHFEAYTSEVEALDGQVYGSSFGRVYINEAVRGLDADGNLTGYVVSVTTADGNDADISLSVGVSPEGVVRGIAFTALNETPGMGMRCGEPDFMAQFEDKDVSQFTLLKDGGASQPGEVDSISGATVTSRAVVNAVNAGLDFCQNVLRGE